MELSSGEFAATCSTIAQIVAKTLELAFGPSHEDKASHATAVFTFASELIDDQRSCFWHHLDDEGANKVSLRLTINQKDLSKLPDFEISGKGSVAEEVLGSGRKKVVQDFLKMALSCNNFPWIS